MLRSRPYAFVGTLTPVSISAAELGLPQYPFSPGGGPRRGLPSGQRGVIRDGRLGTGNRAVLAASDTSSTLFPDALRTTVSPHIWELPFLATMPCTVISSPGFSVLRFQPLLSRSRVLSNSMAQFVTVFPSSTSMRMWTCGFAQSSLVTTPFSVLVLPGSNFPVMLWCARRGAAISSNPNLTANQRNIVRDILISLLISIKGQHFCASIYHVDSSSAEGTVLSAIVVRSKHRKRSQ